MAEAKAKAAKSATMLDFSNKQVEQELKFKPRLALKNLCVGVIESITIDKKEIERYDKNGAESTYEFAGMTVPTMTIRFRQHPTKEDPANRYFNYRIMIPVSRMNNGTEIPQDQVVGNWKDLYARLRHITNAFVGLKEYSDTEECPGVDIAASPETRLEQFEAFLQYFYDILTRVNEETKKPLYEGVALYMKLVADHTTRKYLTFPRFVNRGFIERVKPNINPTLEFAPGETVQLAEGSVKKSAAEKAIESEKEEEVSDDVAALLEGLE